MPRHEDFDKIYKQFIAKHGEEKGKQIYFAWLNSYDPPLDDTKPMPDKLPPKKKDKETEELELRPALIQMVVPPGMAPIGKEARAYLAKAIHAGTTGSMSLVDLEGNPRFRHYTEDELLRSARTLVGKGVNLNHIYYPDPRTNFVAWAEYDKKTHAVVSFPIVTDEKINELYDKGEITSVSVEYHPLSMDQIDGMMPTGIIFDGLAFLTRDILPGDPKSSVQLISDLVELPALATATASEKAESEKVKKMEKKEGDTGTESVGTLPDVKLELKSGKEEIEKVKKESADIVATIAKIKEAFATEEPPTADDIKWLRQSLDDMCDWVSRVQTLAEDLKSRVERLEQILMTETKEKKTIKESATTPQEGKQEGTGATPAEGSQASPEGETGGKATPEAGTQPPKEGAKPEPSPPVLPTGIPEEEMKKAGVGLVEPQPATLAPPTPKPQRHKTLLERLTSIEKSEKNPRIRAVISEVKKELQKEEE